MVNSSQGGGTKDTWVLDDDVTPDALAHRRQSVLARPLRRARRISRAHLSKRRSGSPPCRLAYVGESNEWESAVATAGCADAFFKRLRGSRRGDRHATSSPSRPPTRRRSATASRSRAQCARGAHRADHRDVGRDQRHLARTADVWQRPDLARGARRASCAGCRKPRCASTARPTAPCCATTPTGSRGSASASERADNTARILDVKYHLLLPENERVGGPLDYFQWTAILRSVSALTAYHWVYRDSLKPWLIADLLILKDEMPRSLASLLREPSCAISTRSAAPMAARARRSATPAASATALQNIEHGRHFPARPARIHQRVHHRQQPARRRHHRAVSDLRSRHAAIARTRRLLRHAASRIAPGSSRDAVACDSHLSRTPPTATTRRRRA